MTNALTLGRDDPWTVYGWTQEQWQTLIDVATNINAAFGRYETNEYELARIITMPTKPVKAVDMAGIARKMSEAFHE